MMMDFSDKWYKTVPKDQAENLRYRESIIRKAQKSPDLRNHFIGACASDILFYINAFGWTFDPRLEKPVVPFITYPFQDEAILKIVDAIYSGYDLPIEKSRDMGASWMILVSFEWDWHFHDDRSFLLLSRNENYVDKSGDRKALFQKLDLFHDHQPAWLLNGYDQKNKTHRQKMHMWHPTTKSNLDGESTTGDAGRGDRRTAIDMDEFASFDEGYSALAATADASNCRIINSTPKGTGNAFFDVIEDANVKEKPKLRLHWSKHPVKAEGLYEDSDGKSRSPWYDEECARRVHPMEIAQELDIDYLGSDYQYFGSADLLKVRSANVAYPLATGEWRDKGFHRCRDGPMLLWFNTTGDPPAAPEGSYVVGCDVSYGRGQSNSSLSIGDRRTKEKVAELTSSRIEPSELARIAVEICKWLHGAYLIWEANGPGLFFSQRVVESGYKRFFFRQNESRVGKKYSDVPGWHNTQATFERLIGEYRRALLTGEFINRSIESYREADQYVHLPGGKIVHARSKSNVDPSGAAANHGDRVVADALCWHGMRMGPAMKPLAPISVDGSFMSRRKEREAELVGSLW